MLSSHAPHAFIHTPALHQCTECGYVELTIRVDVDVPEDLVDISLAQVGLIIVRDHAGQNVTELARGELAAAILIESKTSRPPLLCSLPTWRYGT